ncbi:MAG TPA: septum formation initiator family protein [Thermohalobaculum sp.]|nr:septum formation initiator family protein [Thermohalobaculum sp.]
MGRWDWGQIIAPAFYIVLIAVLAVFAHSALQGEHGLAAHHRAEALERELATELAATRAERRALENVVNRLGTDYLDLELLDERARAVLGYVRVDEVVIR